VVSDGETPNNENVLKISVATSKPEIRNREKLGTSKPEIRKQVVSDGETPNNENVLKISFSNNENVLKRNREHQNLKSESR